VCISDRGWRDVVYCRDGSEQTSRGAMRKVEMGRAFVRPSGTEDCVRVYAEAKTTNDVESEFLGYFGTAWCTRGD